MIPICLKNIRTNHCEKQSDPACILALCFREFYGDGMRNKNNKHLGIEIDPELHYKLHYIAKYEGRSGNGQILYLIRQCIRDFEEKNGKIEVKIEPK